MVAHGYGYVIVAMAAVGYGGPQSIDHTLCALILSETLALYKSFTYLLTYYAAFLVGHSIQFTFGSGCIWLADTARRAH